MQKITSGQGATDFGQSTGMTQDELLGRATPTEADSPQKILTQDAQAAALESLERRVEADLSIAYLYEDEPPVNIKNPYPHLAQGRLSDEALEKKIKDIIFANWQGASPTGYPHWIDNAAQIIMGHIR